MKSEHDHQGMSWIEHVDVQIRKIVRKYNNIIFLQNQSYDLPNSDLTIFGGTFWSHIIPQEPIIQTVSDYQLIPGFTPDYSDWLHDQAVDCLTKEIKIKSNRRFVVVSHHLPSYDLIDPKYRCLNSNSAFATEIALAKSQQIVAWFYGHTHFPHEENKFHANPIGYPQENKFIEFNKVLCLDYK